MRSSWPSAVSRAPEFRAALRATAGKLNVGQRLHGANQGISASWKVQGNGRATSLNAPHEGRSPHQPFRQQAIVLIATFDFLCPIQITRRSNDPVSSPGSCRCYPRGLTRHPSQCEAHPPHEDRHYRLQS